MWHPYEPSVQIHLIQKNDGIVLGPRRNVGPMKHLLCGGNNTDGLVRVFGNQLRQHVSGSGSDLVEIFARDGKKPQHSARNQADFEWLHNTCPSSPPTTDLFPLPTMCFLITKKPE